MSNKAERLSGKMCELLALVQQMQREYDYTTASSHKSGGAASFDMAFAAQSDAAMQAIALLRQGIQKSQRFRLVGYAMEQWRADDF